MPALLILRLDQRVEFYPSVHLYAKEAADLNVYTLILMLMYTFPCSLYVRLTVCQNNYLAERLSMLGALISISHLITIFYSFQFIRNLFLFRESLCIP